MGVFVSSKSFSRKAPLKGTTNKYVSKKTWILKKDLENDFARNKGKIDLKEWSYKHQDKNLIAGKKIAGRRRMYGGSLGSPWGHHGDGDLKTKVCPGSLQHTGYRTIVYNESKQSKVQQKLITKYQS